MAPVLDTVFAGLEVARTGYAVSLHDSDYQGKALSRGADIGFGAAFVALFASSAIYGYLTTGNCADAKEQHERTRQQFLSLPGSPLPAAPPPAAPPPAAPPPAAPMDPAEVSPEKREVP